MLRVLHREAVPHALPVDLGEPVEHPERARLAAEQLGEVRLAEPRREALADLDAHLLGQPVPRSGRREIDLAEAAFADQPVEPIGAAALVAVRGRKRRLRRRRRRSVAALNGPLAVRRRRPGMRRHFGGPSGLAAHPVCSTV